MLQPGNYTIPVTFILPQGIPSSVAYKDKGREKQKAKCKYVVKTEIIGLGDDDVMKYKQVLMIREPAVQYQEGERQVETSEIKTWCCIAQGTCTLKTDFEKNIYIPTETAKALMTIDNSNCKCDVKQVTFAVEQHLKLRADGREDHSKHVLIESVMGGPKAEEAETVLPMELDLANIKYEVDGEKKKKGVLKKRSPEDMFQMASIQPAVHCKNIVNEYFLTTKVEHDGCVCCVDIPDSKLPLTIVPMVNPACFGFQPPDGWEPIVLCEPLLFDVARYDSD